MLPPALIYSAYIHGAAAVVKFTKIAHVKRFLHTFLSTLCFMFTFKYLHRQQRQTILSCRFNNFFGRKFALKTVTYSHSPASMVINTLSDKINRGKELLSIPMRNVRYATRVVKLLRTRAHLFHTARPVSSESFISHFNACYVKERIYVR